MTYDQFVAAVLSYMEDHPAYPIYVERVQTEATENRISKNGYGRVRTLFGPANAIKRQALNSPGQGTAADFMGEIMILLDEALEEYETEMVLQVHDELIFEVPDEELPIVWPIIKKIMTKEVTINERTFSIPVDAEIGTWWSLQGSFNEETYEVDGDSKHG